MYNIVMSLINLTQMNHLENGKVKIDFPTLVNDCIGSHKYHENFMNINFITDIEEVDFRSEWAFINTILQNLIENAIKYSQPLEPFVKISVKKRNAFTQISVVDNGQGIDETHQAKIFDMFYRANERIKGSGLGLYILKRAVERLNGTIELKSKLNEGSTFVVTLPA
jgi:signal transduction histidine kinase